MGDSFVAGPWTLGNKYKWMAPIAMLEVLVACVFFCMPFGPAGIPGNVDFAWDNGYRPVRPRGRRHGDPARRDLVARLRAEVVQGPGERIRSPGGRGRRGTSGTLSLDEDVVCRGRPSGPPPTDTGTQY